MCVCGLLFACDKNYFNKKIGYLQNMPYSPSFLGFRAQLRPWLPPQNPAEFLGGFSTIFYFTGRVVSPTPNPIPEDKASVFISSRGSVATHFTYHCII
jgi:hypothetical protein